MRAAWWETGDGTVLPAFPKKFAATHTYKAAGTYQITFTLTDTGNNTRTSRTSVSVP